MNRISEGSDLGYESEQLEFVAYLVTSGKFELVGARLLGPRQVVSFIVTPFPTKKDLQDYYSGTAEVSALQLSQAIRIFRSLADEVTRCGS